MEREIPYTGDAGETSYDLDAMLAAEGQRGHEEHLKGPSIPQLKRAGLDEVSPGSDWYVPGATEGDWILGAGAHAQIIGKRFVGTPYFWRWVFDEKQKVPGERKLKLIATWATEPKDAHYPKGTGFSRKGNGNLLSERVVIDLIHPGPDGPTPCRLTLFGKENRRIAETFRQKLLNKRIHDASGQPKPAPLYATRIVITASERKEERGDGRGNTVEVTVWEPIFEYLGVHPSVDGPDRETILLGRELCIEQEAIKYPDPNAVVTAPSLHVVGSDTTSSVDDGPPSPDPDDPGPTPDDYQF